jgi:double-stranded RNA-binding protein Staufen
VQVHKQQTSEPLFRLINEYGQNRHKEFTVEVRCMGFTATGIGPSKKLAKRASAEQMLSKIGTFIL